MSCGVDHRCGWDLMLLWLWHRPASTASIRSLAWEPPHDTGEALKRQKTKKKKKIMNIPVTWYSYHWVLWMRTLEVYFLSKLQYKTLWLTIITTLYIKTPELIHGVPFDQHLPVSPIPQPLVTIILFSITMNLILLFSFHVQMTSCGIFLCLAYFP